jgi:hypothetical protein
MRVVISKVVHVPRTYKAIQNFEVGETYVEATVDGDVVQVAARGINLTAPAAGSLCS